MFKLKCGTPEVCTNNEKATSSSSSSSSSCVAKNKRVFFTLTMDIDLMRLIVEHNPYQLGKEQWSYILQTMVDKHGQLAGRTIKERANMLLKKYSTEQLTYKTGTEEQLSELGVLLEQVTGYIEASSAPINTQTNADETTEMNENIPLTPPPAVTPTSRISQNRLDKRKADAERDELLNNADLAPPPKQCRTKRGFFSPEDQMIKLKQEQEHELAMKRLQMEERKLEIDFTIQREKHNLERQQLQLEEEKLRVSEEENKRRDAMQASQLKLQEQMHTLLMMLTKK